ncbi:hypothetical protein NQ314_002008 [Rhamnusium bicolor]|uniref:CCDC174 alpha/beta GRSR domain-containing protein n=1 Tax=Rhamnusium bicolor TaxID=1586634 RepID=A0AAV8ZT86_9CUCU|nr:hypothetical protein NQ314_002008 [Rhamnusium bicolor]
MLEAKSRLYDKLSSGKLNEEEKEYNKRYLVRFDKKNKSELNNIPPSEFEDLPDKYPENDDDDYHSDEDDMDRDPGDIWVDYIDCLGRTRKCLQKDLDYLMSKDKDLKKTVEARKINELINETNSEKDTNNDIEDMNEKDEDKDNNKTTQESELISSDMRRELLRQQWEKEEAELRNKSDSYICNVLEARTHGVGYYGFSKDEEERAKQQDALRKLRDETEQKQKKAQELKAMREKQLTARIKAAKNRKRARLGLPPEEEEPEPVPEPKISEEEKKKMEEVKQAEEEKQKVLEEARKHHLRPWDIGKEGVKVHYEMNQEEWVEKKREERPKEFAPPISYRKEFRSVVKNSEIESIDKSLNFTTKKSNKKKQYYMSQRKKLNYEQIGSQKESLNPYKSSISSLNPYKNNEDYEDTSENNLYYEDRKGSFADSHESTDFKEIHQSAPVEPTPIVNLCEETDFDDSLLTDYNRVMQNIQETHSNDLYSEKSSDSEDDRNQGSGVEIAPPPTFEYYGPSHSKKT